jgi:hypothetical protein
MVKATLATGLVAYPAAVAIAFTVMLDATVNGPTYVLDALLGALPSSV